MFIINKYYVLFSIKVVTSKWIPCTHNSFPAATALGFAWM